MTKEDAVKILRACAVLYDNADRFMQQLAENEFSGCSSTQRHKLNELQTFLKDEARKMSTSPNNTCWHETIKNGE